MYPRFAIFCWAPLNQASGAEIKFLSEETNKLRSWVDFKNEACCFLILLLHQHNDSEGEKEEEEEEDETF